MCGGVGVGGGAHAAAPGHASSAAAACATAPNGADETCCGADSRRGWVTVLRAGVQRAAADAKVLAVEAVHVEEHALVALLERVVRYLVQQPQLPVR